MKRKIVYAFAAGTVTAMLNSFILPIVGLVRDNNLVPLVSSGIAATTSTIVACWISREKV